MLYENLESSPSPEPTLQTLWSAAVAKIDASLAETGFNVEGDYRGPHEHGPLSHWYAVVLSSTGDSEQPETTFRLSLNQRGFQGQLPKTTAFELRSQTHTIDLSYQDDQGRQIEVKLDEYQPAQEEGGPLSAHQLPHAILFIDGKTQALSEEDLTNQTIRLLQRFHHAVFDATQTEKHYQNFSAHGYNPTWITPRS